MTVASIVSVKYGSHFSWPLTLTIVTLTFGQGHSDMYALKRIVTKYLCAKFDDCSFNSFREIWQSHFSWPLTLTFMTFGQGHCNSYHLKRIVAKYHHAKFGDCSFNSLREKFNVWVRTDGRTAGRPAGRPDFLTLRHCQYLGDYQSYSHQIWHDGSSKIVLIFYIDFCDLDRRSRSQWFLENDQNCHWVIT